jgi:trk system potassium uptake protein TrkH
MNLAANFRLIFYMCGWVSLFLAGALLIPLLPSLILDDGQAGVFLKSAALVAAWGFLLTLQGRRQDRDEIRSRDGLATVGLAWLMIGFLGALPFWLSGASPTFWDGLFESVSGFSTTGATISSSVETLPPSILFWRALTHWLGGMGVIVLMLAVLPFLGLSGVQLFKNESSMGQYKIKPRVAQTAKTLWFIYLTLTLILVALLLAGDLAWLDAVCNAFSAISTGGFSTRNLSIGHFDSPYLELVLTLFMFLGSLNFALYYQAVRGNPGALFKNTECRVFFLTILGASAAVALSLRLAGFYPDSPLTAARHALFQVVSVISTTGFTSYDWETWPHFSQGVLFLLFFVGGCSGSTSGGLKCIRWILLFKGIHRTLRQHIHPKAVIPARLGGEAVSESLMTAVWSFGAIYFIALALSTLALSALDLDILTALSASASALGNVGLGLGEVGPADNFGPLPSLAKAVLSLDMFLGRLEFFSILILLMPDFWKRH